MKRFGRNQKRRMREQIAQLAESDTMNRHLLENQRGRMEDLREEIRDAKLFAGRNAVLFTPDRMQMRDIEARDRIRHAMVEEMPLRMYLEGDRPPMMLPTVDMEVMRAASKNDEWQRRVHFRVTFLGGEVAYAATREALRGMGERGLVKLLSREMAPILAKQIIDMQL